MWHSICTYQLVGHLRHPRQVARQSAEQRVSVTEEGQGGSCVSGVCEHTAWRPQLRMKNAWMEIIFCRESRLKQLLIHLLLAVIHNGIK